MPATKLIVMYPPPVDVQTFERLYQDEHVPMAVKKLEGKTKIVATKVQSSPQGKPAFYRIAEIHFPSLEALHSLCDLGGWERNPGTCREDFHRGAHRSC